MLTNSLLTHLDRTGFSVSRRCWMIVNDAASRSLPCSFFCRYRVLWYVSNTWAIQRVVGECGHYCRDWWTNIAASSGGNVTRPVRIGRVTTRLRTHKKQFWLGATQSRPFGRSRTIITAWLNSVTGCGGRHTGRQTRHNDVWCGSNWRCRDTTWSTRWRRSSIQHLQGTHNSFVIINKTWSLDWIEQCFTSLPTQYNGRRFSQVKRPNQQYQSTEGTNSTHKSNIQ